MIPAEFADLTGAGWDLRAWAVANCATMDDAWQAARPDWLVWIATQPGVLDDRTLRKFAAWSARRVQHLMDDPRSIAALDVAERHADGLATDVDLVAARDAAWDASRGITDHLRRRTEEYITASAASITTDDSAIDCAKDAAEAAAEPSALSAARGATWSAVEAAARAAARDVWSRALADREATHTQRETARASAKTAEDRVHASARAAQAAWLRENATPDWERAKNWRVK